MCPVMFRYHRRIRSAYNSSRLRELRHLVFRFQQATDTIGPCHLLIRLYFRRPLFRLNFRLIALSKGEGNGKVKGRKKEKRKREREEGKEREAKAGREDREGRKKKEEKKKRWVIN